MFGRVRLVLSLWLDQKILEMREKKQREIILSPFLCSVALNQFRSLKAQSLYLNANVFGFRYVFFDCGSYFYLVHDIFKIRFIHRHFMDNCFI